MRVEKPTGAEPTFGKRLTKREAKLIKSLPKEQVDVFEGKLLTAPIDSSKESSDIRDNIIQEAINLAKIKKEKIDVV